MSAILGTFVSIKTMADGSPRIVLDMQCTLAEVAAMGLIPGVPFALARLSKDAANPVKAAVKPEPKTPAGELCIMACTFCDDPIFRQWARVANEAEAKSFILDVCRVSSRKDLDLNAAAALDFHELIRKPFRGWKDAQ